MSERNAAIAARMGARDGQTYVATGVSKPTPFDTSDAAPPAVRELAVAYCVAYAKELPRPVKPVSE
jgi:hypothetical protein